ncbi:MAG: lactate/malate family dehydrogenase [Vicinamibacterales bacterium]
MTWIAIVGAGALGGETAAAIARRGRFDAVRLIDPAGRIAEGKALDLMQSAPVEQFSLRVTAAADAAAAAGADVIAFADAAGGGEISGETGLALVRQICRIEDKAPLLFCGGSQLELMRRTVGELHVARSRVVGSAALALESAVRAIVAALLDGSPKDVSVGIAGVPPRNVVIGWEAATAFSQPVSRVLPAHELASLSARLPALWPPAPYTLASAASRIADALAHGSRRRLTCFTAIDSRGTVAAVPVELRRGGIKATLEPALSRHERTLFENGFASS